MSAEVILMNKNGIAIAADSAVTIGNKTKIYNTADKMFMLSKYAPVGILIYNSASIMGIQLEIIIKQYRRKLGEKTFQTLKEYCDDFMSYCIEFANNYSGEKIELEIINNQILNKCDEIFRIVLSMANKEVGKNSFKNDNELMEFINIKIIEIVDRTNVEINDEVMDDLYYNNILSKLDTSNIIDFCSESYKINLKEETKKKIMLKLNDIIRNKKYWDRSNFTGIAITGYGDNEIFPVCIQIETLGIINNKVLKLNENSFQITHEQNSQIIPLAQTDVMDEFFLGINNEINQIYVKKFKNGIASEKDESVKNKIIQLNTSIEEEKNKLVKDRLMNIHRSLSFLPRDEMIYMAEGMINLTSFKRRLVLDNFSETVGGPIDIAFISKGEGFIWIKRKKYFDKEMNYVFTENYFNKKGE
ncbi:MAG: hypothetical protein V8S10_06950 [Clostridia bacterium]|jgi:hypothetical protein